MSVGFVVSMVVQAAISLTPMTGVDLVRQFRDVQVTSESTFGSPESFFRDGTYRRQARVLIRGRFWVDGDELCVSDEVDRTPICRSFGRDDRGNLYLTGIRRGDVSEPMLPKAIHVQPLE